MMQSWRQHRESTAREYLFALMDQCGGDAKRAAEIAGRNRTTFYRLLKRYGYPVRSVERGSWVRQGL